MTVVSAFLNNGWAFLRRDEQVEKIIGYFYLSEFTTLILFTVSLIYQMKQVSAGNALRREYRIQATIFTLFALSYLCRFIWNVFLYSGWYLQDTSFLKWIIHDVVNYFDGLSLLALLLLHH